MSHNFPLLVALVALFSAAPILGQPQSAQKPDFEVASIKPNAGGPESGMTQFSGGRYIARYATIKALIGHAYGVRGRSLADRQLVGAPAWLDVDRFDIEATVPEIPDDSRACAGSARRQSRPTASTTSDTVCSSDGAQRYDGQTD